MNNHIKSLPNGDFIVDNTGVTKNEYYDILTTEDSLTEVGKWMDEDKGYRLSTHEKQQEFAKNRNYHYSNTDNPIDFPKESK